MVFSYQVLCLSFDYHYGAVALALAVVPSLKLIVTVKLDPETNKLLASEVKILKLAPSARAKLTVPLAALSSGASKELAAPATQ